MLQKLWDTTKVIDDAKIFYKKTAEKKISRGENKEGLIASCIYHSCLVNEVPRSSKEIAKMFNISHVTLNKGNSRFQQLLQLMLYHQILKILFQDLEAELI